MKLKDPTCACNILTYFEYRNDPPETEIDVILLKSVKLVKSHQVNSFFGGFSSFGTTARHKQRTLFKWCDRVSGGVVP